MKSLAQEAALAAMARQDVEDSPAVTHDDFVEGISRLAASRSSTRVPQHV